MTADKKLALLDHAMWLHNAGVDPQSVLKIAQMLCDWCEGINQPWRVENEFTTPRGARPVSVYESVEIE